MPFEPTTFVNNQQPPLSAAQMNKLGTQYGQVVADITGGLIPVGLSSAQIATAANDPSTAIGGAIRTAVDPAILVGDSTRFSIDPANSGAGLQSVANFAGKGQTVKFSQGFPLTVKQAINFDATKFLTIDWAGVQLTRDFSGTMLNCTAPIEAAATKLATTTIGGETVADIVEVSENVYSGTQSHVVDAFFVNTVPAAWKEGSKLRLVSDDIIVGENYNFGDSGHMRLGEYVDIYRIDAPSGPETRYRIVLSTKLLDTYKTNAQAAMVTPGSINFLNLTADVSETIWAAKTTGRTMRLTGLIAPRITGTRIIREVNYPISLRATLAARVDDTYIHRLANNPEAGQYGYGIHEAGTQDTVITNLNSSDQRHGWTDGVALVSARNERITFGTTTTGGVTTPGVTGGTFTLTYGGQVTTPLAWNATSTVVEAALVALSNLDVGDVTVTGSGPNAYTVSFASDTSAAFTAQATNLTGTNPTLTIARNAPVLWEYGRTQNVKIIGSTCTATSQSAWDTHHGSRNVQFIGCTAYATGVKNNFSLRGENHSIIDCIMIGGGTGVRITTEDYSGESRRHNVINPRMSGVTRAIAVEIHQGENHPSVGVRDAPMALTVTNLYADDVGSLLWAYNAKVEMTISHLRFSSQISIPPIFNSNSEVAISIAPGCRWNGLGVSTVLTSASTPVAGSAQNFIFATGGAGLTSLVGDIDLSDQWIAALDQNRLLLGGTSGGLPTTDGYYININLNKYVGDTPFPVMGMNRYDVKWQTRQTQDGAAVTRRYAGARELVNADIASDAQVEYVGIGSYPDLYLSLVITDATSRTIGRLPVGHFNGQKLLLHFRSSNDNTKTITIPTDSVNKRTVLGTAIVLDRITLPVTELVWNGGGWYRARV